MGRLPPLLPRLEGPVSDDDDSTTRFTLPDGTTVTIGPDGKVQIYGAITEDVIALVQALDPDADIACAVPLPRPPGEGEP